MDNCTGCTVNLMDFSDCLLYSLLQYVDSSSLYNLSRVNKRLERLVLDVHLWKQIDARTEPNPPAKIEFCLERFNKNTKKFCVRASDFTEDNIVSEFIVMKDTAKYLTILAIENTIIWGSMVKMINFPSTLEELSLKQSTFMESGIFFKKSSDNMCNLRVLLLDECDCVDSSVIMSVSKYPALEVLSLYKCYLETSIPYFSIAAWHGFKKLKVLDVRLSGLGNIFLKAMYKSPSLIAVYYQNMNSSYVIDCQNRKSEIMRGAETKRPIPAVTFTSVKSKDTSDMISDLGTIEFTRTDGDGSSYDFPQSVLFRDPYQRCRCGFSTVENQKNSKESDSEDSSSSDDDDCDDNDSLNKGRAETFVVERKIDDDDEDEPDIDAQYNKCLPSAKRKSTPESDSEPSIKKRKCEDNVAASAECDSSKVNPTEHADFSSGPPDLRTNTPTNDNHIHVNIVRTHRSSSPSSENLIEDMKDMVNRFSAIQELDSAKNQNKNPSTPPNNDNFNDRPSTSSSHSATHQYRNNRRASKVAEKFRLHWDQTRLAHSRCINRYENDLYHRGEVRGRIVGVPDNIQFVNVWPRNLYRQYVIDFPQRFEENRELVAFNADVQVIRLGNEAVQKHKIGLKRISFRGFPKITDFTLTNIQHLNLELIDVTYTRVTKEGIKNFLVLNPTCRVVHKDFCVCRPDLHF